MSASIIGTTLSLMAIRLHTWDEKPPTTRLMDAHSPARILTG